MTELDHILAVHRQERRRQDAAADVVIIALILTGYWIYRLAALLV